MKVINERAQVDEVAERWKKAYFRQGQWCTVMLGDSEVIYKGLLALPPGATAKEVAAIIGNKSWAGPQRCHECGDENAPAVVQLGQEPDYESATAEICLPCLRKAVALLEQPATTGEKS